MSNNVLLTSDGQEAIISAASSINKVNISSIKFYNCTYEPSSGGNITPDSNYLVGQSSGAVSVACSDNLLQIGAYIVSSDSSASYSAQSMLIFFDKESTDDGVLGYANFDSTTIGNNTAFSASLILQNSVVSSATFENIPVTVTPYADNQIAGSVCFDGTIHEDGNHGILLDSINDVPLCLRPSQIQQFLNMYHWIGTATIKADGSIENTVEISTNAIWLNWSTQRWFYLPYGTSVSATVLNVQDNTTQTFNLSWERTYGDDGYCCFNDDLNNLLFPDLVGTGDMGHGLNLVVHDPFPDHATCIQNTYTLQPITDWEITFEWTVDSTSYHVIVDNKTIFYNFNNNWYFPLYENNLGRYLELVGNDYSIITVEFQDIAHREPSSRLIYRATADSPRIDPPFFLGDGTPRPKKDTEYFISVTESVFKG